MSAHKYNVETGRYGIKRNNVLNRICNHCSTDDKETLHLLKELPFFNAIIEDEYHILNNCPLYKDERTKAKKILCYQPLESSKLISIFSDKVLTQDLSHYLWKCHNKRFPKKDEQKLPNK